MPRSDEKYEAALRRALELVTEAGDVLDGHDGPPEAGVHLILAKERIRDAIRDASSD